VAEGTDALLARIAEAPRETALFVDYDGVLAPIVPRPEDAVPLPEAVDELRRLAGRYALVAVISGRDGDDVRARVGVDGVVYVGSHGLELDPEAERWRERVAEFAKTVSWPAERKRYSVAFHYRQAIDEEDARRELELIAERARAAGLVPRFGRKVLEILPPLVANKGTAVRTLLERDELTRALVAGDDTTDLDAFAALDGLAVAVRVAIVTDEGPRELRERADVVVEGPRALVELLRKL
jgi:trehalose 6-phosphate phosphatase